MTVFLEILMAALASVTLDNVIFTSAVGTSTLLECAKKPKQMVSFGVFIASFAIIASTISYFVEPFMASNGVLARFIQSLYILSLGLVYIYTHLFIWFFVPSKFKSLSRYVHLTAFNCASLSCLFMNSLNGGSLLDRVIFALCIGVGFMLANYLMYINKKHLTSSDVPFAFRGFPISVLYIGIIAMIVYSAKL